MGCEKISNEIRLTSLHKLKKCLDEKKNQEVKNVTHYFENLDSVCYAESEKYSRETFLIGTTKRRIN